jgi:branched-subunit amino acid transport protein
MTWAIVAALSIKTALEPGRSALYLNWAFNSPLFLAGIIAVLIMFTSREFAEFVMTGALTTAGLYLALAFDHIVCPTA